MFKKGYLPGWTEEVFIVSNVVPGVVYTYKVKEMNDTPVRGTFYEQCALIPTWMTKSLMIMSVPWELKTFDLLFHCYTFVNLRTTCCSIVLWCGVFCS